MGSRGGKGSGGKTQVAEYLESHHIGVCMTGDDIAVTAIFLGDKTLWKGYVGGTSYQSFYVDQSNLFGGLQKEGGPRGTIEYYSGNPSQVMQSWYASRFGYAYADCPGFRGFLSLFFSNGSGGGGFTWQANNPYLKEPSVRVRRFSTGLNGTYRAIRIQNDRDGAWLYTSNPAHMIYECLTNKQWGMGLSTALVDTAAFEAAAVTLYNESFGLSAIWARQTTIEAFVSEIIDHIQATLFEDPETGKMSIKLLRGGYTVSALPEINPDNARLSNFRRKLWGDIANEVTVTWTNPDTEKEETVTAHDLAAIASQGGVVSASRNYYMVRNSALAMRLATRDLAALSHPIADCTITLNRSLWNLKPGDVVRLEWPEHGINSVAMRIIEVSKGSSDNGTYRVKAQEDIYGISQADYGAPPVTAWDPGTVDPAPLTNVKVGTLPAFFAIKALGVADASLIESPTAVAGILAASNGNDYIEFQANAPVTKANGAVVQTPFGTYGFSPSGALAEAISAEAFTDISTLLNFRGTPPTGGDFLFFGDVSDEQHEIALVLDSDLNLARGALDTVPRDWPAGTRAWVVSTSNYIFDPVERMAGETVPYRLLPRTSRGALAVDDAPDELCTLSDRAVMPTRPANVTVAGASFGTADITGLSSISVSWANRNRIAEATQALRWNDPTVAGETSQKTVIKILDGTGATFWTSAELTGTSYSIPRANFGALENAWVEVWAKRSGVMSLQAHRIRVSGLADRLKLSGDETGLLKLAGDEAPGYIIIED